VSRRDAATELAGHFRPELLNRLDAVVRFNGLSRELIHMIVGWNWTR
jgi:ATP-dependent Clp protease ATP-binding subunit ClpA